LFLELDALTVSLTDGIPTSGLGLNRPPRRLQIFTPQERCGIKLFSIDCPLAVPRCSVIGAWLARTSPTDPSVSHQQKRIHTRAHMDSVCEIFRQHTFKLFEHLVVRTGSTAVFLAHSLGRFLHARFIVLSCPVKLRNTRTTSGLEFEPRSGRYYPADTVPPLYTQPTSPQLGLTPDLLPPFFLPICLLSCGCHSRALHALAPFFFLQGCPRSWRAAVCSVLVAFILLVGAYVPHDAVTAGAPVLASGLLHRSKSALALPPASHVAGPCPLPFHPPGDAEAEGPLG
jgi:hypothetical protein